MWHCIAMRATIGLPLLVLLVFGSAAAQSPAGPRISPAFPPAEDIRTPDLTITVGHGPVTSVNYTADGRWLATVTGDGVTRLWEARPGAEGTGAFIRELKQSDEIVISDPSTVSRDKMLRATIEGKAVKVWDVPSGALLANLQGHTANVLSLAFSSNGQKMASGSADGTARTWTVPLPPIPAATLHKITAAIPARATATPARPRRILVVWRADAILHKAGVPAVNHAIELMGKRTGAFEADFTRDAEAFAPSVLSNYDAIVMNSTAHLILNDMQRKAYLDYVRAGGGVVGIHAAIDMFLTWPAGAQVIGATFGDHPWGPNGTWKVKLDQPNHSLLRAFGGKGFSIRDEFYVMGEPYSRGDRGVLMSVDLSDQATGAVNLTANPARAKDRDFALAWIKSYDQGRVLYANFGHIAEPFERPDILGFYLDGIQWVLGDLKTE
jgi:type 1 glutamine amidotransferase